VKENRYYGPIVGVDIYRTDVVVRRRGFSKDAPEGTRGKVTEFSAKSRKRLAFVASNTAVRFRTMVTLTYPGEWSTDGRRVKKDLRRFLSFMQRISCRCSYLWFLEFQARGAPHIHILTDYPLPGKRVAIKSYRLHIARRWYEIVGSGDSRHLRAGTRVERLRVKDGGARYAVKYAYKMKQKLVPEGYQECGRFWGHTRDVAPKPRRSVRCTEDDVRGVLEGWEYKPGEETPVWRVLYNQAPHFQEYLETGFAKREENEYNGAKRHLVKAPSKSQAKGGDTDELLFSNDARCVWAGDKQAT
jgi:hypothetical protein